MGERFAKRVNVGIREINGRQGKMSPEVLRQISILSFKGRNRSQLLPLLYM